MWKVQLQAVWVTQLDVSLAILIRCSEQLVRLEAQLVIHASARIVLGGGQRVVESHQVVLGLAVHFC